MSFGGPSDPHGEPFRRGFISNFEERAELSRRLDDLEERDRRLLMLWHMEGHPVARIARMLGISRVHCYRVQRRALEAMLAYGRPEQESVAAPA
jgi:DNA-directed RNA polymerase specialized sigma subunit